MYCDVRAPYLKHIPSRLPQATIVLDRFHVVQHLNEAVHHVRGPVDSFPSTWTRCRTSLRTIWSHCSPKAASSGRDWE
ncbi:MAG: transposase [Gammaproteobacteria bacterium]|nr:transposase [Gammaproteobacteria bacterium]